MRAHLTSIAYLLSIPLPMLDLSTLSVEHIKFQGISTCHLQYLMTKTNCILKLLNIYIYTRHGIMYIYIYYIFQFTLELPCQPQVCPQTNAICQHKRHPETPGFPPRCLCHLLASSKHLSQRKGNRSRTDSWCVQECRLIESFVFVSVKIFFRKNWWVFVKTRLYISTFKS